MKKKTTTRKKKSVTRTLKSVRPTLTTEVKDTILNCLNEAIDEAAGDGTTYDSSYHMLEYARHKFMEVTGTKGTTA